MLTPIEMGFMGVMAQFVVFFAINYTIAWIQYELTQLADQIAMVKSKNNTKSIKSSIKEIENQMDELITLQSEYENSTKNSLNLIENNLVTVTESINSTTNRLNLIENTLNSTTESINSTTNRLNLIENTLNSTTESIKQHADVFENSTTNRLNLIENTLNSTIKQHVNVFGNSTTNRLNLIENTLNSTTEFAHITANNLVTNTESLKSIEQLLNRYIELADPIQTRLNYKNKLVADSNQYFDYFHDLRRKMGPQMLNILHIYYNTIKVKSQYNTYKASLILSKYYEQYFLQQCLEKSTGDSAHDTELRQLFNNIYYPLIYDSYKDSATLNIYNDSVISYRNGRANALHGANIHKNNYIIMDSINRGFLDTNLRVYESKTPYQMNSTNTQLLTETDEEFEIKVLENILQDLKQLYVRFQIFKEFGVDFTRSFDKDAIHYS
jgi:hypothetical protein